MTHKSSAYSLLDAPAGCRLRVKALAGDAPSRSRLCALGFTPGTDVTVTDGCPCRASSRKVCIRGSSLVLGSALAECVLCDQPVEDSCPHQSKHRHNGEPARNFNLGHSEG